MRKFIFISAIVFFFSIIPLFSNTDIFEKGSFRFAFINIKNNEIIEKIENKDILYESFKSMPYLFFQPLNNAFLYIFLVSSSGELKTLFPHSFRSFDKRYDTFKFFIPENRDWSPFLSADADSYALHLLIAPERLNDIEDLVLEYQKIPGESPERKKSVLHRLLLEIKQTKRDFLQVNNARQSKAAFGGTFRDDIETAVIRKSELMQLGTGLFSGVYNFQYRR